jgi:Holliday junction DNA helicase RuvA
MIAYISGQLVDKNPAQAIVENGGVGYAVLISLNTYKKLPDTETNVHFHVHLHVREDQWQLFGFTTVDEKRMFERLIGVSGIGPKLALVILSGATPGEFALNVVRENVAELTKIPGIGKKTAQRLVFDLKDKLASEVQEQGLAIDGEGGAIESIPVVREAVMALVSLGYPRPAAERALEKAVAKNKADLPLEELIKNALVEL